MAWFPVFHMTLIVASVLATVGVHIVNLFTIPVAIYLVPLAAYHLHAKLSPLQEGSSSLVEGYSPWYGGHMIQQVFIAFPVFENLLILFPGAFAGWLRAWGSSIGNGVYFAPHFELADRGLLDVGDGAIFGYGVKISGHIITPSPKYGGIRLMVQRVHVGAGAFVGAGTRMGPGVTIEPKAVVRAATDLFPGKTVKA